ncbi:MAG: right-handed parallel beta-helix repeat-containing protein [Planctomycetales bacterium]|nr:right-handed parallel beta-helix repeat-containing protein [Planctomycetales bacterium]MBN8624000.1 right-handed parallel beta-helix repeat-containing protein [Planctomycetota bacterium]
MSRSLLIVLAAALALAGYQLSGASQAEKPAAPHTLPGARAVIQAANYPTLQAALDAIPEEGGVVELPPGVFEITEPLKLLKGEVLLRGCGSATHIVNKNEAGEPALVVRHPEFPEKKDGKLRKWRVQIADLRITGNEKSGHGIEANYVQEIFIHGVTVSYHGKHGIFLDYCYEDPRVSDCLITYNKQTGLEIVGCHDIVVCGNHFEENLDAVRCIDAYNLCMTGNNVDDHLRYGVVIENTYGSVVSGNMIEECNDTGIILDRDCYGITLSANVIAHEMKCGIDLRDAHGCAVTGNSFPLVHDRAVVIGKGSGRIPVVGNAFSDSYIGTAQTKRPVLDDPSGGLVIEGARDVAAVANTFTGLAVPAVQQPEPGENIVVELNIDVDNGKKKAAEKTE